MNRPLLLSVLSLLFCLAAEAFAQNWEADASFRLPPLESNAPLISPTVPIGVSADGRVLVVRPSAFVDGQIVSELVRFNVNGLIDAAYSPPPGVRRLIHTYADGRALVADDHQLLRLLPDGAIDSSFERMQTRNFPNVRAAVSAQGSIWLWGNFQLGNRLVSLALIKPEGGWDDRFVPPNAVTVSDAAVQPDGKLVIAGRSSATPHLLFRITPDGAIDPTFDATTTFGPTIDSTSSPHVVAVLPDGRVIAASSAILARMLPSGAPDPLYPTRHFSALRPLVGRASTSGVIYYVTRGSTTAEIRRINADGTDDASFLVRAESSMVRQPLDTLPATSDERVLYFPHPVTADRNAARNLVTRVVAGGAIDPNFRPRFSNRASLSTVIRQPDGKYLVAGSFDFVANVALVPQRPNFVRLNPDGSWDRSFQPPAATVSSGTLHAVLPVAVQPGGKILAAMEPGLRRLHTDGTLDASFPILRDVVGMDREGFIFVRPFDGQLQRLSPDGNVDTTFNPPAVAHNRSTGLLPTGGFLYFTPELGANKLTWLRADGSVSGVATYNQSVIGPHVILPDGSVMLFEFESTGTSTAALRVFHFDISGRQLLSATIPGDLLSVAGVIRDALKAQGGGQAFVDLTQMAARGRISVHDDEILILPQPVNTLFASAYPLGRYRPRSPAQLMAPLSPVILLPPASRNFVGGASVEFRVWAYGAHPRMYQWFKDGVAVGPPRESSGSLDIFRLSNVGPANIGDYTVRISNAYGTTTSAPARLGLLAPPAIEQTGPGAITVLAGQTVALTIRTSGDSVRYTYIHNGVDYSDPSSLGISIPGGTFTLLFRNMTVAQSGAYRIQASDGISSVSSGETIVTVVSSGEPSRLSNVSVRTQVGRGDQSLILGFVISGDSGATQPLLARGIGPALSTFGVSGVLADPQLTLRSGDNIVAINDNWAGDSLAKAAAITVGAFTLSDESSGDAVIYRRLSPGAYTLQLAGADDNTGQALAEIYDASGAAPIPPLRTPLRLVNLSSRARIAANSDGLIAGFVIAGTIAKTVLVRAVGASLAQFGVEGFLAGATLVIRDGNGRIMAENLTRGYDGAPDRLAETVGAFPLTGSPDDNAIAITLPPGPYTAQVMGRNGSAGVVLIEVYEVP